MAYSLIANTIKGGSAATSTGVDTTGADLLLVSIGALHAVNVTSIVDNKGNTLIPGLMLTGSAIDFWFYYVLNPNVGSGHTVTVTMDFSVGSSFEVLAFSGAYTGGTPVDQSSTAAAAQPGSITPTQDNELLIALAACQVGGADVTAIDSGFTLLDHQAWNTYPAFSAAYQIQTTATARNPTWSSTWPGFNSDTAIVSFKAAAGGGGGGVFDQSYYYRQIARMGGSGV